MNEFTDNTNRYFRGQMSDEEVMAFSRKHWVALIPDVIPFAFFLLLVTLTVLLLNKIKLPSLTDAYFQTLVIILIAAAGWLIHRFFLHTIRYFLNIVIITNYRVVEIKKTLFLRDTKESLDMRKIQNVEFKQVGLIGNFLKFGDIHITLGTSEIKTFSQLPNPDFHFRLLNRLKNDMFVRQQRSINQTDPLPMTNTVPLSLGDTNIRPQY